MKRVLVTGPVERIGEWSAAARAAGWEPIELPLLEIVPRDVDARDVLASAGQIDWLCVTSSSAIAFVERALRVDPTLHRIPAAVVGERSAEMLRALGFTLAFGAQSGVAALARSLGARASEKSRMLWPRGDRSDVLARSLRALGHVVFDPIVYATRSHWTRAIPACEAVFFASPSAVAAWHEHEGDAPTAQLAIAIGPSTGQALHDEVESKIERMVTLAEPTPAAFEHVLAHLDGS